MIGDNVDHNARTLDGKNTFHGMGMIAATIPYQNANSLLVPRKSVIEGHCRYFGCFHSWAQALQGSSPWY